MAIYNYVIYMQLPIILSTWNCNIRTHAYKCTQLFAMNNGHYSLAQASSPLRKAWICLKSHVDSMVCPYASNIWLLHIGHSCGDHAGVDSLQLAVMVCLSLPSTSEYCTEDTQRWSQLILTVNMMDSHYDALYVNHKTHMRKSDQEQELSKDNILDCIKFTFWLHT